MKKLIVFILAAVLVSCSQQETNNKVVKQQKEYVKKKESKKNDYSEPYKCNIDSNGVFYYERSLDTIKVSGDYVIIAVYNSGRGISTVVIGRQTRLE